jgi:hypothetical protein
MIIFHMMNVTKQSYICSNTICGQPTTIGFASQLIRVEIIGTYSKSCEQLIRPLTYSYWIVSVVIPSDHGLM